MMKPQTLTRAELFEDVHNELGLPRQECAAIVERTLDLVIEALERGDTVKLSGFGVFQVRGKNARVGRNPKTGKEVPISPRRVMVFKPSAILKQRINAESDGSGEPSSS